MVHIVIVPDGLADNPGTMPKGKTPMSLANVPHVRELTAQSLVGRVKTCSGAFKPGSDIANMAILGYSPEKYFQGRAAIEAFAGGVMIPEGKTATRMNFVSVSEEEDVFENRRMVKFDAGGVNDREAMELLEALKTSANGFSDLKLYFGSGFHHLIISNEYSTAALPHEIIGERLGEHLPTSVHFREFICWSNKILTDHPVNIFRKENGKLPVNAVWPWSSGKAMLLPNFWERTGLRACMITATDVLRGLAVAAGMDVLPVKGATGTLETNYRGKGDAAIRALTEDGYDFVYIHIEASDAAGHNHRPDDKMKVYEEVDRHIIGPLLSSLKDKEFRLLLLPDHFTDSVSGKHGGDPVPYLLYDSTLLRNNTVDFSEAGTAYETVSDILELFDFFIRAGVAAPKIA